MDEEIVIVTGDLLYSPMLANGVELLWSKERQEARTAYLNALQKDAVATLKDFKERYAHSGS